MNKLEQALFDFYQARQRVIDSTSRIGKHLTACESENGKFDGPYETTFQPHLKRVIEIVKAERTDGWDRDEDDTFIQEDIFDCPHCTAAFAEIKVRKGHKEHLAKMRSRLTNYARKIHMANQPANQANIKLRS